MSRPSARTVACVASLMLGSLSCAGDPTGDGEQLFSIFGSVRLAGTPYPGVKIVFSLDGLGLLGYQSAIQRDYPVMFGTLYIFTLLGLLMQIVGDTLYTIVDPRIDFESRR